MALGFCGMEACNCMKKVKKRIVAVILVISMIFEMIAVNMVSSAPISVSAATSKKITTTNIYSLAPEYLNNDAYSNYFNLCARRIKDGIESVSDSQQGFAVFWESIKQGADIITRNVLATFGYGRDYEEEFKYNLVKEILFEYIQTDQFADEVIGNIDKTFSNVKTISKASKEWSAADYKAELKAANKYLSDSDIDKVVDEYVEGWKNVTQIADVVTKGADVAQFVTTALMMNEIENKALDDIYMIVVQYGMDLADVIAEIQAEKNDFLTYFKNTYLNDKVRGEIVKNLKHVSGYDTATLIIKVIDLLLKYTLKPVSVSDIVNATLAYGYALQADTAVSGFITMMMNKKIKGEDVSAKDIENFKTAYNFMIAAYKIGLEKASKCVKGNANLKMRIDEMKSPLGSSVGFGAYLEACVEMANRAVDDGTLVIQNGEAIKKTPDGTIIDEKYDSTESITAKMAAIKEQYPIGTTWTGKFDGAIQCFGFAKLVFYHLFGNYLGTTYQQDKMYQYNPTSTAYLVGQVNGSNVTRENIKSLMASAKIGDIIQGYGMGGYQRGQHTMIFLGLTDNGIEIYDCNAHLNGDTRDCVINQWTISYDTLALNYGTSSSTSGNGLSVYRAVNYNEIYGDGENLFYDDSVNFVINNGVLTKYNGWQSYVTIPDTVTEIGKDAFKNNTSMMYVEIPDSVTSIGDNAFYGCKNLVTVSIPDSVKTIGSGAFSYCASLASVYLPQNKDYTIVSSGVFSNCTRLKEIIIPDAVTKIGTRAFSDCTSLKNVKLSKKLETLSKFAFYNCDEINEIEVPNSLKSAGDTDYYNGGWSEVGAFVDCDNLKEISFEEGTTNVATHIFAHCNGIEKITIPDSVTTIESYAFYKCQNLVCVDLPENLVKIGECAFYNASSLANLDLPKNLEAIGGQAFHNCVNLTEIVIPKNLKVGGGYTFWGMRDFGAFDGCSNLKNIKFEDGISIIPIFLFKDCNGIESITIPDTVTTIKTESFKNCTNLREVVIPDSVTTIGDNAFEDCTKLEMITIPDSVTKIGDSAFSGCTSLKNVKLSKALETLGESAFYNCDGLTEIEIPKSIKYGGGIKGAFSSCSDLKNVYFEEGTTRIATGLFARCDGIESIVIPDTVTTIEDRAFYNCINLKEVTIPDSVTNIGSSAFSDCTKLETITIPDSVTTIGSSAFSGCSALTKVSLSDNITTISQSTFSNCKKLGELKLPEKLKRVEAQAFYNCDSLTEIEFPYRTTYIGNNVLQDAGALTKVTIPNTVTYLGSGAFYDCTALKEVVWGSGITDIKAQTFYGCTALPKITIPETVTKIGNEVFKNCVKLYDVSVPESVTSIPLDAFSYPKKTTIYGYKDSYAENYALQKGINFVAVEKKKENFNNNITIEYDIFEIPDSTELVAEKLSENNKEYQSIAKKLEDNNITTAYEAYDIKLIDIDNRKCQPTGEIQVKMPLPIGYQASKARVYCVENDGTFTDIATNYKDGKLVFTTKYLDIYLVAEDELKEKSHTIYGDANSDGVVNSKDVVMMKKYLAGYKVDIDLSVCDVNMDGAVNSKDVVKTMKKLAGYNVVLGTK